MATIFTIVFLLALIACIVFFIKSGKLKKAGQDNSQAKKTAFICLGVALVSFIIVGLSPAPKAKEQTETPATNTPAETTETAETETKTETEEKPTIVITAGEKGEYGQDLVLNAGTDMADEVIGYFVPVGTYEITNNGEYMTQVNVYKNEVNKTDDGWEEWADGKVERLDIGETKTITIEDGYFVNVDEPAKITLVQVN